MSCKWPYVPACKRVRISNLLTSTVMFDGDMLLDNVDIDDLALSASNLLDQFRKRGMDYTIQRNLCEAPIWSCYFIRANLSVWTSYLQPCKSVISSQNVAEERVPPVPIFGVPWTWTWMYSRSDIDAMDASQMAWPSWWSSLVLVPIWWALSVVYSIRYQEVSQFIKFQIEYF